MRETSLIIQLLPSVRDVSGREFSISLQRASQVKDGLEEAELAATLT